MHCQRNKELWHHSTMSLNLNFFLDMHIFTPLLIAALCIHHANAEGFFINNVGRLHLSEQKWEIQHVLNLTEFMETSKVLEECIDNLKTVCNYGNNPLCSYFERATENLNTAVETDTSKLATLSRKKRFLVFIPIIIGVSIVSLWAGISLAKSAIDSIKDDVRANLDIIGQAANISITELEMMEQFMKDNDEKMAMLQTAINNNTKNLGLQTRFFNIINVISFSAQLHEKMEIKLNDIYFGDIDARLFEIIDLQKFLKTMKSINERLSPNLTLPNITTISRNAFIKTFTDFNSTHLTVSVDLPVMRKFGYNISELVPLPIGENGKVYILDMPTTTYYENGSQILMFPNGETKDSLCKMQDELTICNTFLEDYYVNASGCLHNLLKGNSDIGCRYKEIAQQNYFIQLSHDVLYFHLTYPIKMVMDCRGKVLAMTMTKSGKVYIPKGCEIYKYTDKHFESEGRTSQLDITPPNVQTELNLANGNENKKLSYLPLWDKYNIQFMESRKRVIRIRNAIFSQEEKLDEISGSTGFGVLNFFKISIEQYLVYGLIILLLVILTLMVVKALLIKLLTDWRKNTRPSTNL